MIADHNDQAIVDTVLNLARNLGLAVIAEGIEDEPTAARLRSMGCGAGQGYLYARPMPNQQLLAWLADRAHTPGGVVVPFAAHR
jgi:EAL domain-containing protein (putative c-di-GMP-specific phosphodiesterase class I)